MKIGKKIITLIGIFALVYTLFTTTAVADGGYFSIEFYYLNEPMQKAVIGLDGETEIMILASSVRADNLTDVAWIVPIISTTNPNVTSGNISIFRKLVNYFNAPYSAFKNSDTAFGRDKPSGNIEIIEIKEIDIYDIIILKASNTSDLTEWLLENNFKIPEESYSVLEGYVNKENCYFVINKIDLKNRFKDVINKLDNGTKPQDIPDYENYSMAISDLRNGMSTPLRFEFTPPEPYYPLTISSFSEGYGSIHIYVIAEFPVTDKNQVLTLENCKSVNNNLKENLSLYLPVEKANYVSRLTYYDKLSKLSDDAVFINFPLFNPEKPISVHSTDDLDFVIADHHIWGLCKNKIVIELQYKFDDDVSWRVANGSYLWSIDLGQFSFIDGEHTIHLRVLKQGYDQKTGKSYIYSDTSSFDFLFQGGKVVEIIEPIEQDFHDLGLFLYAILIIGLASVAIIAHKIKS